MSSCEVMRTERAQWRGLDFEWIDEAHTGANRLAIHKYVDRDTHSVKPIGCDPERWTVRGYICGERLRDRVRDFRDAFKRRGPGRLYDPWQNEDFDVYAENWSINPTRNILGTEFSATFVDAGEGPYPIATLSPLAAFADAIEQLEEDASQAFTQTFSVIGDRSGSIGFAISDSESAWGYIGDSYRIGYQQGPVTDLSAPSMFEVAGGSHYSNLEAIFEAVDEAFSDDGALSFHVRNIYIGLGGISPFGPAAAASIENNLALEALIARTSFARAAAITINRPYPTREHAQQAVNQLSEYANSLQRFGELCDDPSVTRDIQCILNIASQIPSGLPPLRIWNSTIRQCSLTLAYDIYCDVGRSNELATLNNALTSMPANPCYAAD